MQTLGIVSLFVYEYDNNCPSQGWVLRWQLPFLNHHRFIQSIFSIRKYSDKEKWSMGIDILLILFVCLRYPKPGYLELQLPLTHPWLWQSSSFLPLSWRLPSLLLREHWLLVLSCQVWSLLLRRGCFCGRYTGKERIFGQLFKLAMTQFLIWVYLLMTPRILEAMRSTVAGFEGFLDLMSTAELDTTVSIAFRPAAFMVSPDSEHC